VSDRYIPALDGIRGLAILLVLFHHFRFILEPIHRSQRLLLVLADAGWCGVELFFVLSGFLVTGILLDTWESPRYFRTFYARRVLRIFPLYFLYLAVVVLLLSRFWTSQFGFNPWVKVSFWPYFLYLENFKAHHMFNDLLLGHLWSLAVEEQFYTVWPLIVALLPRRALEWTALLFILVAVIYRFEMAGKSTQLSFYVNTFTIASLDSLAP
jgi:peptidoglycan/LPS O-acetylase OafA/YrhL